MYRVHKDRIQTALKDMNSTHDHFKCQVKQVTEKDYNYEVFVEHDNSYPYVTGNWEENNFYGRTDFDNKEGR
jgi:bacillopeptidase F (M6 metalloprotease family)